MPLGFNPRSGNINFGVLKGRHIILSFSRLFIRLACRLFYHHFCVVPSGLVFVRDPIRWLKTTGYNMSPFQGFC